MTEVKIALVSATPMAIAPATAAIVEALPDVTIWNLMDDRLLADVPPGGGITADLAARMERLIDSAIAGGADGVLLTCSQYGASAEARTSATDGAAVVAADGPLFAEVLERRPARVLLVASLRSAADDSTRRLQAAFEEAGATTTVTPLLVPEAARIGPDETLGEVLSAALDAVTDPYDMIVLAQYTLAPAAQAITARRGIPVLDGPSAAARRLVLDVEGRRS